MRKKVGKKVREQRAVVSRYIREELESGRPYKQAIAIAFSRARREGYSSFSNRVPAKKRKLKAMS